MSDTPIYTIYQPEGDAPRPGDTIECRVIGAIRTPYKRMEDCPSRHNKLEYLPVRSNSHLSTRPVSLGWKPAGGRWCFTGSTTPGAT